MDGMYRKMTVTMRIYDSYDAEKTITVTYTEQYLGPNLSSDSRNTTNIDKLYNQGMGIKTKL